MKKFANVNIYDWHQSTEKGSSDTTQRRGAVWLPGKCRDGELIKCLKDTAWKQNTYTFLLHSSIKNRQMFWRHTNYRSLTSRPRHVLKQPKLSATYKKYNAKQKTKTKIPCKAQEKDPAVKDNIGEKSLKNGFWQTTEDPLLPYFSILQSLYKWSCS